MTDAHHPPRRNSPRRRLRLRVATSQGTSLTINVSRGGFCTGLMRVLPVGSHVEGLIFLGDRDASFAGQVTWARAGDSSLNLMGKMGVRFVEIDPAFARSLDAGDGQTQAQPDDPYP